MKLKAILCDKLVERKTIFKNIFVTTSVVKAFSCLVNMGLHRMMMMMVVVMPMVMITMMHVCACMA